MLSVAPILAFADNYIWMILNTERHSAVLVDPGDAAPVFDVLQTRGIKPVAILITHHHADHTAGIHALVTAYNIPVYGPECENIRCLSQYVREGDVIQFDDVMLTLHVMEVPGHTRGHLAYYGEGMLFCGDTLFSGGCGRLFEGTAAQMYASLNKIAALPDNTQIYCAHEYTAANLEFARTVEPNNPDILHRIHAVALRRQAGQSTVPSLLGEEKHSNPFLRCHLSPVKTAAENFAGHTLTDASAVFATVRRWKDSLD
jgi:hydroxyacylglutathione hydrolase